MKTVIHFLCVGALLTSLSPLAYSDDVNLQNANFYQDGVHGGTGPLSGVELTPKESAKAMTAVWKSCSQRLSPDPYECQSALKNAMMVTQPSDTRQYNILDSMLVNNAAQVAKQKLIDKQIREKTPGTTPEDMIHNYGNDRLLQRAFLGEIKNIRSIFLNKNVRWTSGEELTKLLDDPETKPHSGLPQRIRIGSASDFNDALKIENSQNSFFNSWTRYKKDPIWDVSVEINGDKRAPLAPQTLKHLQSLMKQAHPGDTVVVSYDSNGRATLSTRTLADTMQSVVNSVNNAVGKIDNLTSPSNSMRMGAGLPPSTDKSGVGKGQVAPSHNGDTGSGGTDNSADANRN